MHKLCSTLCSLALAAASAAQTFVVDAAGGPGSSFTDLPAAIAAVPDGAVLLVRPGTYTAFEIVGKGVSVLGGPGAVIAPNVGPNLRIVDTTAAQPVIVRGFEYSGSGILRLDTCAASVLLEDLTAPSSLALYAGRCDNLLVRNCGPFRSLGPGMTVFDSTTTLVGCDCGPGAPICLSAGAGRTYVVDCAITGGLPGTLGSASAALEMTDDVILMGTTEVTGWSTPVGTAAAASGFGTLVVDDGVTITGGVGASLTVVNESQAYVAATGGTIGSVADASLTVPTGALGALLLGRVGTPLDVPGFGGVLWLDTTAVVALATGVGAPVTVSLTVPNAPPLQGTAWGWQGLAFTPARGFFFGNVVPFAP